MAALFVFLDLGGLSCFANVFVFGAGGLGILGTVPCNVLSRALKGLIMILFGD